MGPFGVKFWGTRGLIASPRLETAIFGGNTPCVQIVYKDHLILIDTGFGCCNLGESLVPRLVRDEKLTVHVFYTHFHWDHIQGLAFFAPIYFKSSTINLYSPESTATTLDNLNILFDGSYSPFESLLSMQAKINLHALAGSTEIDGLKIDFHPVDHGEALGANSVNCFAYKLTDPTGAALALITDHEARPSAINRRLVAWAKGVDLLIHDGQFTDQEYKEHVGWGHSSARAALANAAKIEPAMTLLTHHDPGRDDREMQALHRALLRGPRFRKLAFEFAREETLYEVAKVKTLPKAG
jgi:phosphoribosyl 1,2-cyclic phosphodiesterase